MASIRIFIEQECISESVIIDKNIIAIFEDTDSVKEVIHQEDTEKSRVICRNVSCQAKFPSTKQDNVAFMFCGLFSPSCDAETQCDLVDNHGRLHSTKENITQKQFNESKCFASGNRQFRKDLLQQAIDDIAVELQCNLEGKDDGLRNDDDPMQVSSYTAAHQELLVPPSGRPVRNFEDNCYFNRNDSDLDSPEREKSKGRKRKKHEADPGNYLGLCEMHPLNEEDQIKDQHFYTEERIDIEQENVNCVQELVQTTDMVAVDDDGCSDWITDDEVDDSDHDDRARARKYVTHGKETRYKCKSCLLMFNSELLLLEHTQFNHIAHVCNICGFTTTYGYKLKRHMVKHSKEKAFSCNVCGRLYSQKQNLKEHISRSHSDYDNAAEYPFNCQYCKKLYCDERNLIKHQNKDCGPCEICGAMLNCSGLLWQHRHNHICSCHVCHKEFKSRKALNVHMSCKHRKRNIQCSECPKKFIFQSQLKTHFDNAHKKEPQYRCDKCSFCAKTLAYLRCHQQRMHINNQKLHPCVECGKSFDSNARLIEHIRTHTGERPFICPLCYKKFYTRSNLYAHERNIHKNLQNTSSKKISSDMGLSKGRRELPSCYECKVCKMMFPSHRKLSIHLTDHRISNNEISVIA